MTVTRGKEHVFLGMNIKFNDDGTVTIDMGDYVKEAIKESGANITRTAAATPAKRDLFEIDENSPALSKKKRELFHSVTAKLLYVSKRGRLDIQLATSFLCTRVSCSTEEDWSKLVRILEYLHGTPDLKRTIGADSLEEMITWVEASFSVHHDMKSHTGGVISFGTGAALSRSSKQKLNTKSSTEAELVGASDYLPFAIWAKAFLEKQGFTLKKNRFLQDNQSAIQFEKNGRKSCGPNSRHIDIRYFFVKDRLEKDGFKVEHCPTKQMVADFFTKPLQGGLFKRLRDAIMGKTHMKTLEEPAQLAPKERVEIGAKNMGRGNSAGGEATKGQQPQKREEPTYAHVVRKEVSKAKGPHNQKTIPSR